MCPIQNLERGSVEEGIARTKNGSWVSEGKRDEIYLVKSKGIVN